MPLGNAAPPAGRAFLHLLTISETRPIMLMYFPGGKSGIKFPCAKLGQNSAGSGSFRLISCPVQTTGVGFEIFAEGKRFAHGLLGYFIVSVVDEMVDQREHRYQFPIFREVSFEGCRHSACPQSSFEITAPIQEIIVRCCA